MFDKTKYVWRIDLTLITANLKETYLSSTGTVPVLNKNREKGLPVHHTRVVSKVSTIAMSVMN